MSSAGTGAAPPRPSVFISYASEDRTAARALRDALTAAGIDVWYDESDLTGGDAWDQKLRRQIRDCDYFMPVVSAATERRKEGYFRREWRLAAERTLDMADDVLFLVPVVIDATSEATARVPEKFLTVQWLRLPGGQPGPALDALARRLLAGDHTPLTRAPWTSRTPVKAAESCPPLPPPVEVCISPPAGAATPPPMPPFPPAPEKGGFFHGVRFGAEVLWWALTAAGLLFSRLPKWGRVVVVAWLIVTLFSVRCSPTAERPIASPARPPSPRTAEREKKARQFADRISQSAREGGISLDAADLKKLGNDLAQVFSDSSGEGPAAGKPLLIVPFAPPAAEDAASKFAHAVFLSLYGRLSLERRGEVGVTPATPEGGPAVPLPLIARGRHLGSSFILSANPAAEGPPALVVQLVATADGSVAWTESFPIAGSDPTVVAESVARKVLELVPKKAPRRGK